MSRLWGTQKAAVALAVVVAFVGLGSPAGAAVSPLWVARYKLSGASVVLPYDTAVSADGARVFVVGRGPDSGFGTVAYNAATGKRLWASGYHGPGHDIDTALDVAVAPNSQRIYVTGLSKGVSGSDFATIAYDAVTGERVWVARYDSGSADEVAGLDVSPDGSTVFVSGSSHPHGSQIATVAYDAATGLKRWVSRFDAVGSGTGPRVSADGAHVFVTGDGLTTQLVTVAFDTATGARSWIARYDRVGAEPLRESYAADLAVSPDSATVFVLSSTDLDSDRSLKLTTVAYDAATGNRLWDTRQEHTPGASSEFGVALAVSGDGTRVVVTGTSGTEHGADIATVGYDATSGAAAWQQVYSGPADSRDEPADIAISPDGHTTAVTGIREAADESNDIATLTFDTATGEPLKRVFLTGTMYREDDGGRALAFSPTTQAFFVAGCSMSGPAVATTTIAYPY